MTMEITTDVVIVMVTQQNGVDRNRTEYSIMQVDINTNLISINQKPIETRSDKIEINSTVGHC